MRFGERSIDYRHYVRELAKKPQAVRQVAAELMRDLGPSRSPRAWRSLVDAHGPKQAARVFAKVLAHVEARGIEAVAATLAQRSRDGEPLLLALASPRAGAGHADRRRVAAACARCCDVASAGAPPTTTRCSARGAS